MRHTPTSLDGGPRALRRGMLARRVWCDPSLPKSLIHSLSTGDVDSVLFASTPLQVKDRCIVARREIETQSLLVKRHSWGSLSRTLRMAFREAAADSSARVGIYLSELGIPTPRPRATVNLRLGPWSFWSYLVSDFVEGESLYRYIRFGKQSPDELRHVARQVAEIWRRLVDAGVTHNDFKPENFIVDPQLKVWLIDLERVRLGGKDSKQQQRHVFDIKNFLHVRGWHRRSEARAIFAEELLKTPHGNWLQSTGVQRVAAGDVLDEGEQDTTLSVVVVCENGSTPRITKQAIDSVRDIADEAVIVQAGNGRRLQVLRRINLLEPSLTPGNAIRHASESIGRSDWVLALQQNECVTPFLAKELQQRITGAKQELAFRIPIEHLYFGRSITRLANVQPVRLFQQSEFSLAVGDETISIKGDAQNAGQLTGLIQAVECATVAEYVDTLNHCSSAAALERHFAGEQPRLVRSGIRSVREFISKCVSRGGVRSGWAGVQLAALESAFHWVEEMKLHQLNSEFHRAETDEATILFEAAKLAHEREADVLSLNKAA
jgi:tRNA A-37 threonylcarbamoyl transferase component Bud32